MNDPWAVTIYSTVVGRGLALHEAEARFDFWHPKTPKAIPEYRTLSTLGCRKKNLYSHY